jgi:hypothetical protein
MSIFARTHPDPFATPGLMHRQDPFGVAHTDPHAVVVNAIADAVAEGDDEQSPHQREVDLEEAEWIVEVVARSGYRLERDR